MLLIYFLKNNFKAGVKPSEKSFICCYGSKSYMPVSFAVFGNVAK